MTRNVKDGPTKRELEVIAAWWHTGTVISAADLLGIRESTAKNLLHTARLRTGQSNTLMLAKTYSKDLPSVGVLRRKARKAA